MKCQHEHSWHLIDRFEGDNPGQYWMCKCGEVVARYKHRKTEGVYLSPNATPG